MPRHLVLTGGPGKTTLVRYLARQSHFYPLLLVDHDDTLDALHKLVAADDQQTLVDMLQTPMVDLSAVECLLSENLVQWSNRTLVDNVANEIDLLKAGQPLPTLTPLWRSACKRLFSAYKTVIFDGWQPAWNPWLPDCTVIYLGSQPPTGLTSLEQAGQLAWLQVECPGYNPTITPYDATRIFWPKVGRIPWVAHPVSRQPAYAQAIETMLQRLG